jgi:hypothetical protein
MLISIYVSLLAATKKNPIKTNPPSTQNKGLLRRTAAKPIMKNNPMIVKHPSMQPFISLPSQPFRMTYLSLRILQKRVETPKTRV